MKKGWKKSTKIGIIVGALLLIGLIVFVTVQAVQLKNTNFSPVEINISLRDENPKIRMLGVVESDSNVNGIELKGYSCDVYHREKGHLGTAKSIGSQVLNRGWFRSNPDSGRLNFETEYALSDANFDTFNSLLFDQLIQGIQFLDQITISCKINLRITLFGIPISYDHSQDIENLRDVINIEELPEDQEEPIQDPTDPEDEDDSYFKKLRKTFNFKDFSYSRFHLGFQKTLPQLIQAYQTNQISDLTLPLSLNYLVGRNLPVLKGVEKFQIEFPEVIYKYSSVNDDEGRNYHLNVTQFVFDLASTRDEFSNSTYNFLSVHLSCEDDFGRKCFLSSPLSKLNEYHFYNNGARFQISSPLRNVITRFLGVDIQGGLTSVNSPVKIGTLWDAECGKYYLNSSQYSLVTCISLNSTTLFGKFSFSSQVE